MKRFLLAMFVGLVLCFGSSNAQAQYVCGCWTSIGYPDMCLSWSGFAGNEVPGTRKSQTTPQLLSQGGPASTGQCPAQGSSPAEENFEVEVVARLKYEINASFSLANFDVSGNVSTDMTNSCKTTCRLFDWCQCCHIVATRNRKVVTADFICHCSLLGITCTGSAPVSGSYTEYSHPQCTKSTPPCTPLCVKDCPG